MLLECSNIYNYLQGLSAVKIAFVSHDAGLKRTVTRLGQSGGVRALTLASDCTLWRIPCGPP